MHTYIIACARVYACTHAHTYHTKSFSGVKWGELRESLKLHNHTSVKEREGGEREEEEGKERGSGRGEEGGRDRGGRSCGYAPWVAAGGCIWWQNETGAVCDISGCEAEQDRHAILSSQETSNSDFQQLSATFLWKMFQLKDFWLLPNKEKHGCGMSRYRAGEGGGCGWGCWWGLQLTRLVLSAILSVLVVSLLSSFPAERDACSCMGS